MSALPEENVEAYPRPPRLERVSQTLRVILGGHTVALSEGGWRICETYHAPTYYIPASEFAAGALRANPALPGSFCEWKGRAVYYDLEILGERVVGAAWRYLTPTEPYAPIAKCVAVYPGKVEACWVGAERVTPQPGDYYGGWVTPNLRGRIKGAPGTEGW